MTKARDIADRKLDGTDLNFGDNDKAIFGAGSDVVIQHNTLTGNSILADELTLEDKLGSNYVHMVKDGAVSLYYDASKKLATTSTGIDVTGTATMDGLTVDGRTQLIYDSAGPNTAQVNVGVGNTSRNVYDADLHEIRDEAGVPIARFEDSGDISFYEDTGTTAKFFWDASAESLGIGTSSPSGTIQTKNTSDNATITNVTPSLVISHQSGSYTSGNYYGMLSWAKANSNGSTSGAFIAPTIASTGNTQSLTFGIADAGGSITERMRIDSSGNVGIGTSSPSYALDVKDGDIRVNNSAGTDATIRFANNASTAGKITYSSSDMRLFTAGAERMRIDSSGNLLVGTTTSAVYGDAKAQIVADALAWGFTAQYDGTTSGRGAGAFVLNGGSTNPDLVRFSYGTTPVGTIRTTGSSVSYNTSSDYRLKEDWQPVTNASDRVAQLKPVNFAWKVDGTRVDGFLAHELQEVIPEAVTGTKDAMRTEEYEVSPAVLDDEGNVVTEAVMGEREVPDYQGIDQSKLVPLLTAALQEALTEIDNLKQRVNALETN